MNERRNIIVLYKTPIHVLVCKVGRKTYVFVRLIQVLKNSMA